MQLARGLTSLIFLLSQFLIQGVFFWRQVSCTGLQSPRLAGALPQLRLVYTYLAMVPNSEVVGSKTKEAVLQALPLVPCTVNEEEGGRPRQLANELLLCSRHDYDYAGSQPSGAVVLHAVRTDDVTDRASWWKFSCLPRRRGTASPGF